jgi:hypothetical protein
MPFVLIALGLLLIVVALRNTQTQLGALIVADFTGAGNFFYWLAAIFIIGAIGYIDELKTPSRMFVGLVLLAMILSNQGFFQKFVDQLKAGSAQAPPPGPAMPGTATAAAGGVAGAAAGPGLGSIGGAVSTGSGIVNAISGVTKLLPFLPF